MKIIDRYLLFQFTKTFLICFLSLTGLIIVFDALTNLEEFLRCSEKMGGLLRVMSWYYGCRTLLFYDRLSALLILAAAMFTVTWIQRHNELIALMAAGISRVRVIRPILIAAVALTLLAVVNRELVLPRIGDVLALTPNNIVGDVAQSMRPRYDNETDVFIEGRSTFKNEQRVDHISLRMPHELESRGSHIKADNGFYRPPEKDRPGGYLLAHVTEPKDLDHQASWMLGNRPVIITPHDAPGWVAPGQCFLVSQMTFQQLTGDMALRQYGSTPELVAGLRNRSLNFQADVRVTVHSRLVQPILDMALLFLGLPLVVARSSRNIFRAIGMCLGVVSTFLTVTMACQYVGTNSLLPAALSAWIPVIVFAPAAVGMADTMWE